MKKILIFCLTITLLMSSVSLTDNDQETKHNYNLLDSAENYQSIESLEIQENDNKPDLFLKYAEELKSEIKMLEEESTTEVNRFDSKQAIDAEILSQEFDDAEILSAETMFVTGIKSATYDESDDVPRTTRYSYYRPSDGAIFSGILSLYYTRVGYFDYAYQLQYQGFYEGTLTLQYYDN